MEGRSTSTEPECRPRLGGRVEQLAQRVGQLFHRVGLLQVSGSRDLLEVASAVVVAGGVENLQLRAQGGEPLGELDPAHLRHQDVRHQKLDRIGMVLRELESRGPVSGEQNRVAVALEYLSPELAERLFVL